MSDQYSALHTAIPAQVSGKNGSGYREVFWVIGFMTLFGLFVCGPMLYSAVSVPPGKVFAPLRDPNYLIGDSYYYAAFVNKIAHQGIGFDSLPTAAELQGKPNMENFRFVPLALAALPAIVSLDIRFIYVAGLFLSGCFYFLFPYLIARLLGLGKMASVFCATMTYFYCFAWWGAIPGGVSEFNLLSPDAWKSYLTAFFHNPARYLANFRDFNLIGSQARYINLSVSGPFFLAVLWFMLRCIGRGGVLNHACYALLLILIAYSYPSHNVIMYMLTGSVCLYLFFITKDRKKAFFFGGSILIACAFLLAAGYPGKLQQAMTESVLWTHIVGPSSYELKNDSLVMTICGWATNKYALSGLLMFLLIRKSAPDKAFFFYPLIWVGVVISMLLAFKPFLAAGRFFDRGLDIIWILGLATAACIFWNRAVQPFFEKLLPAHTIFLRRAFYCTGSIILFACLALPYAGTVRYARNAAKGDVFLTTEENMEALRWLNANAASMETVAAVHWHNISVVPLYSQAAVLAGHMVIDGRTPEDEIQRYAALWKALQLPREELHDRLVVSAQGMVEHRKMERLLTPPFNEERRYNAAYLTGGLVYWPYVAEVHGIPVATKDRKTSPEFINYFMEVYDSVDPGPIMAQAEYIMLSLGDFKYSPIVPDDFSLVFENSEHRIFRRLR